MKHAISNLRCHVWSYLFLICPLVLFADLAEAGDAKQNIVLILADDLGYGDLSCYGQSTLETPHLDQLAAEGMRFTRHYAGCTVCSPSRCVLMTGLHIGHAPVRGNVDPPMADSVPTIARRLKTAGYATGAFGKWGIGNVIPEDDPNRKGFDLFYGYVDMFHAHNLFPPFLVRNGKREPLRNELVPGSDKGRNRGNGVAKVPLDYAPDLFVEEAIQFIDDQRTGPFFLYLALNTPHANNEGQAYGRGMEVPDFGPFKSRDWPKEEKGFARLIHDVDQYVGRVIARLHQHNIADDTLVIFTSDNGPHEEGGHLVDYFDSNGSLRGKKRDLYEGGVRVPMLAWSPGIVPAGKVCNLMSGFQDYMPTFCELAGVSAPENVDGISLLPTLRGENPQRKHDALYFEFHEGSGKQSGVIENWKVVRLNWMKQPDAPLELYDLASDIGEEHDVAPVHPEIIRRMERLLAAEHTEHAKPSSSD